MTLKIQNILDPNIVVIFSNNLIWFSEGQVASLKFSSLENIFFKPL